MNFLHITVLALLSYATIVRSATPQMELLEQTKVSELLTVLDTQLRDLLTEFHQIRDGDINFLLVSRENSHPTKLNDSNLNLVKPERLTNFVVGGWLQNFRTDPVYSNLTNEYLRKADYNIIIIDDDMLTFYPSKVSMSYIQPIGIVVSKFIVKLHELVKVSLNDVSIIGQSLGGNVASIAGKEVAKLTGNKIGRIICLDAWNFPVNQVNKKDAKIVQLIHTSATPGISKSLGTVDFYPNGGAYDLQPGCSAYPTKPLTSISDAINYVLCSHHKSYKYFLLTINRTIKAVKCKSYAAFKNGKCKHKQLAIFGDNYVSGPKGSFYLYLNCTDTDCISSYS